MNQDGAHLKASLFVTGDSDSLAGSNALPTLQGSHFETSAWP